MENHGCPLLPEGIGVLFDSMRVLLAAVFDISTGFSVGGDYFNQKRLKATDSLCLQVVPVKGTITTVRSLLIKQFKITRTEFAL